MPRFVHLHLHSEYSLLDGLIKFDQLFDKVRNWGGNSVALTDHGNMFGAIEFYSKALENGVKPILGMEAYVAPGRRDDKNTPPSEPNSYHLTLIALNSEGYSELSELSTAAYLEGFYYKPRIDKEILATKSRNLIALSGCWSGEVAFWIRRGNFERALKAALEYREIFGERFFLEIQMPYFNDEARQIAKGIVELSRKTDIPLVATNDVHYLNKDDHELHEVLLAIQTQSRLDDKDRFKVESDQIYLKTPDEMYRVFGELPEALEITEEIASWVNIELDLGTYKLPYFAVPEGETPDTYLEKLCLEGLKKKYGEPLPGEVVERLDHELKIIRELGFSSYFLIVWDYIRWARENGIPVGPGRGSAAGSIVAYALDITKVDPLKYGLLFERFLNPHRKGFPDIDVDIADDQRDRVIAYLMNRYGAENVARICTFGTMKARMVVRDVGRVLGYPNSELDRVSKMIPQNSTLVDALSSIPELQQLTQSPKWKKLFDLAMRLEGTARHVSMHAAGVVISPVPLKRIVPLFVDRKGLTASQYEMNSIEKLGLLKMDLLGLRNLTVINQALKIIEKTHGVKLDLDGIDYEDREVYELLGNGETIGIFQLDSSGMRELLRKLKPSNLEDLIALLALYRPGPLQTGMVDDFIDRKHGRKKIEYPLPELEDILKETYGVIVYQEQVMKIAVRVAGYSMADADNLRRAMSKKKPEVMAKEKEKFIKGAMNKGYTKEKAEYIFDLIEKFAGYGFNKSHSAAYAVLAFQTAFLKRYYPTEYMAALLTSVIDNRDRLFLYLAEAKRMGIEVLPPDINESYRGFTVVGDKKIRFGLGAIKKVGDAVLEEIIAEREKRGPFKSFLDFLRRVDQRVVNRQVVEMLIKSGALDRFGRRESLIASYEIFADYAEKTSTKEQMVFQTLFASKAPLKEPQLVEADPWPENLKLSYEKDAIGFYISGHPVEPYEEIIKRSGAVELVELAEETQERKVRVGGLLTSISLKSTKRGDRMAVGIIEDLTASAQVVFFPNVYSEYRDLIEADRVVVLDGRLEAREDTDSTIKILVERVLSPEEALNVEPGSLVRSREQTAKGLVIDMEEGDGNRSDGVVEQIWTLVRHHPGRTPLYFVVRNNGKVIVIKASDKYSVSPTDDLIHELEKIVGEGKAKAI